ncbi:hypothetical protein RHIZ404_200695 [Rhizobium sp. EC-SD404]|nr:hypothetical protein RHIZ404_200695 [Rhizobium sp. EC-SD404]
MRIIDFHDLMNIPRETELTNLVTRKDGTIISMHDNIDAAMNNILFYYHEPMHYILYGETWEPGNWILDIQSSVGCFDIYLAYKATLSDAMPRHIGDVRRPTLHRTAFIFPIYNAALEYIEDTAAAKCD